MSEPIPTPRVEQHLSDTKTSASENLWVTAQFARDLERETIRLRALLATSKLHISNARDTAACRAAASEWPSIKQAWRAVADELEAHLQEINAALERAESTTP